MHQTFHIGEDIQQYLKEHDLTISWLARQINCDQSNLTKQLRRRLLHGELMYRISNVLKVDFYAPVSRQLSKDWEGQNTFR